MKSPPARIVIVDDGPGSDRLVRGYLEQGVECLRLRSREPPVDGEEPHDGSYDADLGYVGDVTAAARLLRPLEPDAVLAASPQAADFATRLARALGMRGPILDVEA